MFNEGVYEFLFVGLILERYIRINVLACHRFQPFPLCYLLMQNFSVKLAWNWWLNFNFSARLAHKNRSFYELVISDENVLKKMSRNLHFTPFFSRIEEYFKNSNGKICSSQNFKIWYRILVVCALYAINAAYIAVKFKVTIWCIFKIFSNSLNNL